MTKSASANPSLDTEPVTSAFCRFAASAESRPRASCLSISACTYATPASTRAWSRSVITTGTCSRRTNSSAICAAIRPAPTMPTLVTGRASGASGAPAAAWPASAPGRRRTARRAARRTSSRSTWASSSAANPSSRVGAPGRGDQVDRPVRGHRGAVQLAVGEEPRAGDGRVPVGRRARARPAARSPTPPAPAAAQRSDSSRKSAGSNIASAMPSANASGPRSILFCDSGFSMITFSALAGPISRGSRYAPPQPGTMPRKHSGRATAGTPEEIVR